MMRPADTQYNDLCKKIRDTGVMVFNERTQTNCLTIINHDLTYRVGEGVFPLDTTRKSFWKAAVAELLGYIRGESDAMVFKELGANTWVNNANAEVWQTNPFCKGENDMGRAYGVQGNDWWTYAQFPAHKLNKEVRDQLFEMGYEEHGSSYDGQIIYVKSTNQLKKIVDDLKRGVDDRGEILMFHNPGEVDQACLRSCMYSHHFSLLDGTLYLNSTQRSCDVPIGLNFNMVQVYVFLMIMAEVTGHKAGEAYHKLINTHFYENQLDTINMQMEREPLPHPIFRFKEGVKLDTYEDMLALTTDDFELLEYQHHEPVKHQFTT